MAIKVEINKLPKREEGRKEFICGRRNIYRPYPVGLCTKALFK